MLLLLTWRQSGAYASPVKLYEATLRENRQAWLAHNNLGIERLKNLLIPEAIVHFQRALQFQPDNAESHTNLANAFSMEGHFAEAISEYQKAIDLAPTAIPPCNNLAWLLANCHDAELRDSARAVVLAKKAVEPFGREGPGHSADAGIGLRHSASIRRWRSTWPGRRSSWPWPKETKNGLRSSREISQLIRSTRSHRMSKDVTRSARR